MTSSRAVAFDILRRVARGAYAADLLAERTAALDPRDAGLVSEIVFGVLRFQAQLDFLSGLFSGRPGRQLDEEVRLALRMGIYQLRYLDRIPRHAAVSESVDLVKRAGLKSAASFVNAVLRRAHRTPVEWPDNATRLSHPEWILARWEKQFSPAVAERIAEAFLLPPETYMRVPVGACGLREAPSGLRLEPTEIMGCFRVVPGSVGERWTGNEAGEIPGAEDKYDSAGRRGPLPVARTPAEGSRAEHNGVRQMDIGSQSIVPLLDLAPGQRFLDVCAAPGNKTAQALEYGVQAVACDIHWARLATLRNLYCSLAVADAKVPLPFRGRFDRILVDAPCSGTGTLGRNPEIKWKLRPGDISNLHARQVKILQNALALLAPGGRLVYSTCSLEREENEAVVEEVLGTCEGLQLHCRIPGQDPGDGFFAAVIPSEESVSG